MSFLAWVNIQVWSLMTEKVASPQEEWPCYTKVGISYKNYSSLAPKRLTAIYLAVFIVGTGKNEDVSRLLHNESELTLITLFESEYVGVK